MKKLIITVIVLALALPSLSLAIQKFQRTGKIETDESGGYSEAQRDHHVRRKKQKDAQMKGGYYEGGYHNKSTEFKQGEWQFVDSSKKEAPTQTKKKYKKVKEN